MNDKQKKCLWVGIAFIVVMGLFPPWAVERKTSNHLGNIRYESKYTVPGPYAFIAAPPARAKFVDLYRLGVQCFVVAVATAGLIVTFNDKQQPDSTP